MRIENKTQVLLLVTVISAEEDEPLKFLPITG
jgi:hypothetical protein